jgi:chromosome partitioning protein
LHELTRLCNSPRMRVITFVTQKGGSGKTALALSCAVAAEQTGQKALILDLDPQGSAEAWYQDREAEAPRLARITPGELDTALHNAKRAGFQVILIDTPGRDDPATAAAIRVANLCVVPCRPTPADMKATPPTAATIKRLNKAAAFVLTQTPVRGFRINEARAGLGMLGMVAPTPIVSRNAHQDAYGAGQGVTEFEPDGKAAEEIRELWAWLSSRLERVT